MLLNKLEEEVHKTDLQYEKDHPKLITTGNTVRSLQVLVLLAVVVFAYMLTSGDFHVRVMKLLPGSKDTLPLLAKEGKGAIEITSLLPRMEAFNVPKRMDLSRWM